MRPMEGTSELAARAGLVVTILLLAAARLSAQNETQTDRRIVVSLAERKLALVEHGAVKAIYPVAIGRASTPSPSGTFTIINRVTNPTYYHKGEIIGPGPLNPVGTRWIGLSQKGYGIHGTNAPRSVGKSASHGCLRMAKNDLEALFAQVRIGDVVEIHADHDQEVARIFGSTEPVVVAIASSESTATTPTEPSNATR